MTNTFRKHHKTVMWVIIVGTIFSFVWFLSPTSRNGGGGRSSAQAVSFGSINGEPIAQADFQRAVREARLVFRLSQRRWPGREQEELLRQIAYQRLFVAAKLKELNLTASDEAAARYTRQILGVPDGQTLAKDKFMDFLNKEMYQGGGVLPDDFDHFVRVEVGKMLLMQVYGMNGQLITQKEAEFFYRRENESMTVELARFDTTNYMSRVAFTTEDLQRFYTNRQSDYRLPAREQVSYIKFDASNYLAAADLQVKGMSNLDVTIDQLYSSDQSSYVDDQGKPLSETAAKSKIRNEILPRIFSRRAAQTNAYDLTSRLLEGHDKNHPVTLADMQKLAETNGLTVTTPEPFDQKNPPADLQLPPAALGVVFQLEFGDPDDQYKLLEGTNAYYLVGLQKQMPSEGQSFEQVRAKVADDYRNYQATEMVKELGTKFAEAAATGLAAGRSFDSICEEHGIKPELLSPFSSEDASIPEIADRDEFSFLVRVVYDLPSGKSSSFAPEPQGGFVACVKSRAPVSEDVVQREIPGFLARFRQTRELAAFDQWLQREMHLHVVMADPGKIGPMS